MCYLAIFFVASPRFEAGLTTLAAIPLALAAWAHGLRGAFAWGSLLVCAHWAFAAFRPELGSSLGPLLLNDVALLALALGLGALRDRTERQLRRLRAAEQRYERAAHGANDVLFEWELETGSAYFSSQWPELVGCTSQELGARIAEWFDRVHPEDIASLKHAIDLHRRGDQQSFAHVHRLRRKDGGYVWVLARGVASSRHEIGPPRITGWLTDVTERKRSEAQLRRLAFHDALTGLPNRALFVDRVRQAQERARRKRHDYAVLLADLDRFKVINDSLGPAAGDLLLMKVARILRDIVRSGDSIARLGGDEFAILLEELERPDQAEQIATEVLGALCQPIDLDGHRVVVAASLGISLGGARRDTKPEDLLREADLAMCQAKALGGERLGHFDPAAHAQLDERLDLENELRKALEADGLQVHYQPIVDLDSGDVVGFEALARFVHPRLGNVSPGKFIPVAEEAGLIERLGESVLRIACRQAQTLRHTFPDAPAFRMGVNLSVAQLARTDLGGRIERALGDSGLPPSFLSLEITESGLLEDTETAARTFERLQGQGVSLAMDDFGTGYSSLQYLRRFRIDSLKIDGSFVRDLHSGGEEICAAIVSLGKDLGVNVIAEGVERPEEMARLRKLGARYAQGFVLSRPLPAEQLSDWLSSMPGWRLKLAS